MSKYDILAAELTDDPLGRGYAGMTDLQVSVSLNTVNRTRPWPFLTGDDAFQATDSSEFAALTNDTRRGLWLSFCARDTIDPFATANVAFVTWLFGGGSQTVANLASVRQENLSRAEELGLPPVSEQHVANVRAM